MGVLLEPATLLGIILVGYLFKRFGLFRPLDYRVLQTVVFDLVLPGAIIYSFATNPHDPSLLLVSAFAFVAALIPPLAIFLTSRHRPTAQRAFLMLNGSGFNIGCFCFPMLQSLLGTAALVPAAMFDIGNSVMVSAGTNVMTQGLLHIRPGQSLDPDAGEPVKLDDPDARKLHRKAAAISIFKGFLSSPSFDTYLVMVGFTLAGISLPDWSAQITRPLSAANAFCSMLMVGMLMDLPGGGDDVKSVLQILAWRLPFGILFATAAWYLLPFEPLIRQAVALCCLAPTAVFATMFTDKVLGNARLAGFTLALTAVIGAVLMVLAHLLMGAI
ncbi:AEC family transporter [Bifidobacterium sp. H6bp9]|uniref:AEC family transporter n=1 Tax=Bifidobacterium sp. H6bp9 TaxID=3051961 RepID=UPI0028BD8985|nr:AEC family transporter [Bifidobacterium sp. H6bp9]MDT7511624.1 AEC family transporter [Bifidobacterium sp. H6bp9]